MIPDQTRPHAQGAAALPLPRQKPCLPQCLARTLLLVLATCLSACGGCAAPECEPDEIRVADTCYPRRTQDAGASLPDGACDASDCESAPEQPSAKGCDLDADCPADFACKAGACRFVPPVRVPSATSQASGTASSESARYRVRWSAGAPHPVGTASSRGHRVQLGARLE